LIQRRWNEKVQLIRIPEPGLVGKRRAESPDIGNLSVLPAYILTAAVDRADRAIPKLRIIAFRLRDKNMILRAYIIVEAPKVLREGVIVLGLIIEVILRNAA
jgi:hypothetical protein